MDNVRCLSWKTRSGLLISVNRTFLLGVTAEALRANIGAKSAISLHRGPLDPKCQVEGVAPTNHSSSQKTRLNGLSQGVKTWTYISSVLLQCTRLTDRRTNRQTDTRTEFSSLVRVCILCRAAKNWNSCIWWHKKAIYISKCSVH